MWYRGGVRVGVIFPQTDLQVQAASVRAYALGVEALGYTHVVAFDHVLGADPKVHQNWRGPYDVDNTFHEPLVLYGYLAALTSLELVTGILILPQRQTALVAKQAAEVDLLCGGRLRLGIGLGWNAAEYEALGRKFTDRGRRVEEQVQVLRSLWTQRSITHQGPTETLTGVGIAPLPVQRPIPIWFGATSEVALRRAGRLGDGWFPSSPPGQGLEHLKDVVEESAREAGRDPARLGMEGSVTVGDSGVQRLVDQVGLWEEAGATHVSISTMGAGLHTAADHLEVLSNCADALHLVRA